MSTSAPQFPTETTTIRCGTASATIAHHGAHLLSFIPEGGSTEDDLLWVSEKAEFRDGKAIRGGIPICWPWFADHPTDSSKPAHGVARTQTWELLPTASESTASFRLTDSDASREIWPHAFELILTATVSATSLEIVFRASNPADATDPIVCQGALHTYLAVSDVTQTRISGLGDSIYIDKLAEDTLEPQIGDITIDREVDRIYLDTVADCLLHDPQFKDSGRNIRVAKEGSTSTVIWNPWIDKAARMGDFGDDEYPRMVCIETTNSGPKDIVQIAPGQSHELIARISLETS